ncbi:unnamed protein product, partial [Ectocarpus sp. 12 AP-2014]
MALPSYIHTNNDPVESNPRRCPLGNVKETAHVLTASRSRTQTHQGCGYFGAVEAVASSTSGACRGQKKLRSLLTADGRWCRRGSRLAGMPWTNTAGCGYMRQQQQQHNADFTRGRGEE